MLDISSFLDKYIAKDEKVLVACSAWPDSMFLLYHLMESDYRDNIVVCYFNHETRPECEEEQDFLIELWQNKGFKVECSHYNFDNIQDNAPSKCFEELAREKRYTFFRDMKKKYSAQFIITGHHLDDRIETFFFNMVRGTKLTGLINMSECSWDILRPMLSIEKHQIQSYLDSHWFIYFIDSSNNDHKMSRNKLRLDIISRFESINSNYKKNISQLLLHLEEIKQHLDTEVISFLAKERFFSIEDFNTLSSLLQKEVIRHIYYISNDKSTIGLSEANIQEIIRFINGKNNKTVKEIRGLKMEKDNKIINW